MSSPRRPRVSRTRVGNRGLRSRLLAAQAIVLAVGGLTIGLVALVVGPAIFHQHLVEAGHLLDSPQLAHIEMAYRDASLIAIGVGLVSSLSAAVAVSWLLSLRLRRPLHALTLAAQELSHGHYGTRVQVVGAGAELESLADTFNVMAARLEGVEDTRRRLLSDLGHELRTPIATLSAYHEGLADGLATLEQSRPVLTEQTTRLARLADDISAVSSAEEGQLALDLRPLAVGAMLRAAQDSLRERYAAKGVALVLDAPSEELTVTADRDRIGQVLSNLLANALRHTPAGGRVVISARRDGDRIAVAVADDGEGMTAEQLQHAFERFYRGDSARSRDRGGTGIGLTISRAIVDAHGGYLTADSPGVGRGTVATMWVPISPVGRRRP